MGDEKKTFSAEEWVEFTNAMRLAEEYDFEGAKKIRELILAERDINAEKDHSMSQYLFWKSIELEAEINNHIFIHKCLNFFKSKKLEETDTELLFIVKCFWDICEDHVARFSRLAYYGLDTVNDLLKHKGISDLAILEKIREFSRNKHGEYGRKREEDYKKAREKLIEKLKKEL